MRMRSISLPEIALIAGSRAALGVGVGLLVAHRLSAEQRRAVGWTLLAVGVASTFPLAAQVVFRGDGLASGGTGGGVVAGARRRPLGRRAVVV